ncbi:MAG: ATP-binding cassette domain-containing protein [Ilumatobacteraceae bacterium]
MTSAATSRPALEVTGVAKAFGAPVLTGIDLAVASGEAVGIIGPNGAGKSTLLNIVAGELRADAGSVHLDGVDVSQLPAFRRCRSGLVRTSQIPRPFERLTVFENVLLGAVFGSRERRSERDATGPALAVLERSGLIDRANEPAGSLRMLDRRRLELARALVTEPSILLLDEIGGGLTDLEVVALVEEIKQINESGVTIVWIEHIVHALEAVVHRLVAIAGGVVVAAGPPAEVLADADVQAVYLGLDHV